MGRKYNFLYKKIVRDERDVVGSIAYALYKASKINHIEQYKSEHNDTDPSEEVLERFHSISCLDDEVKRYRLQATAILQDFLSNTLSETTNKIEKQTQQKHFEMIQQIVSESEKKLKPKSFWYGVAQGALGSFVLMLILGGIMLFFVLSSHELSFTVGNGGVRKIQTTEVPNVEVAEDCQQ